MSSPQELKVASVTEIKEALQAWRDLFSEPRVQLLLKQQNLQTPGFIDEINTAIEFSTTVLATFDSNQKIELNEFKSDQSSALDFDNILDEQSSVELLLELQPVVKRLREQLAADENETLTSWIAKIDKDHEKIAGKIVNLFELEKEISTELDQLLQTAEEQNTKTKITNLIQKFSDLRHNLLTTNELMTTLVGNSDFILQMFSELSKLVLKLNESLFKDHVVKN